MSSLRGDGDNNGGADGGDAGTSSNGNGNGNGNPDRKTLIERLVENCVLKPCQEKLSELHVFESLIQKILMGVKRNLLAFELPLEDIPYHQLFSNLGQMVTSEIMSMMSSPTLKLGDRTVLMVIGLRKAPVCVNLALHCKQEGLKFRLLCSDTAIGAYENLSNLASKSNVEVFQCNTADIHNYMPAENDLVIIDTKSCDLTQDQECSEILKLQSALNPTMVYVMDYVMDLEESACVEEAAAVKELINFDFIICTYNDHMKAEQIGRLMNAAWITKCRVAFICGPGVGNLKFFEESVIQNTFTSLLPLPKTKQLLKLNSWEPVAVWGWDLQVDECPICHHNLMEPCIHCTSGLFDATSCTAVEGICRHMFHRHCFQKWSNSMLLCPLDDGLWILKKTFLLTQHQ